VKVRHIWMPFILAGGEKAAMNVGVPSTRPISRIDMP